MFRILGSRTTLCDGFSRRDWCRLQEPQGTVAHATPGSGFGQAKSCILLYLFGSPSQHDTFDPKPDAPEDIRGELASISTVLPGTRFCELLPKIARVCDRTTIVRSMTHPHPDHL